MLALQVNHQKEGGSVRICAPRRERAGAPSAVATGVKLNSRVSDLRQLPRHRAHDGCGRITQILGECAASRGLWVRDTEPKRRSFIDLTRLIVPYVQTVGPKAPSSVVARPSPWRFVLGVVTRRRRAAAVKGAFGTVIRPLLINLSVGKPRAYNISCIRGLFCQKLITPVPWVIFMLPCVKFTNCGPMGLS